MTSRPPIYNKNAKPIPSETELIISFATLLTVDFHISIRITIVTIVADEIHNFLLKQYTPMSWHFTSKFSTQCFDPPILLGFD